MFAHFDKSKILIDNKGASKLCRIHTGSIKVRDFGYVQFYFVSFAVLIDRVRLLTKGCLSVS